MSLFSVQFGSDPIQFNPSRFHPKMNGKCWNNFFFLTFPRLEIFTRIGFNSFCSWLHKMSAIWINFLYFLRYVGEFRSFAFRFLILLLYIYLFAWQNTILRRFKFNLLLSSFHEKIMADISTQQTTMIIIRPKP